MPLGVVASLAACEDLCYKKTAPVCQSFTWHHTDFGKKQYAGHCYAHTDAEWGPVAQGKIDSGCRNDLPHPPPCSTRPAGPAPGPTPTPLKCKTSFDCSGNNGVCQAATGTCKCNAVRPHPPPPPHTPPPPPTHRHTHRTAPLPSPAHPRAICCDRVGAG
eukprot:COSAG04_NODE_2258_length_4432_cov_1.870759_3_plen_160_part_00